MGLLSPLSSVQDPKRRVGAYLCLSEKALYEVLGERDNGLLEVRNVKTGYQCQMTVTNVKNARLVTPAQDEMESLEAAYEAAPVIPDPD